MPFSITQILHIARTGMMGRLQDLDVVSNNLANVNTIGYKSTRSNFQELLDAQQYGGTQLQATQRLMQQGRLQSTQNSLDVAIQGEGFFAVKLPDGRTAYTRNGEFQKDASGQLVTATGFKLVWQGQIPQDATDVRIDPDGKVFAHQGNAWNQVGTIGLTRFANPNGLQGYGESAWLETPVSGTPQTGAAGAQGFGKLQGSTLEQANVDISSEMTQMISLQRSYQMATQTFKETDQMLSEAINMRRG
jgi:flagellar basal-body rod protein FlgG